MKIDVRNLFPFGAVALAVTMSGPVHASIVETYEAPGVMNTTTTFTGAFGVETFDGRPTGQGGFTSTFGNTSTYTGSYSAGTQVQAADMYGGANGTGNYAVTFSGSSYTLTLNTKVTYFGYWLSALDAGNIVNFYNGATLVGSLNQAGLLAAIGGNVAYYGNPNSQFNGQDKGEPFAFVNFYGTGNTSFDRVVFSEVSQGFAGYESDNHTVGNFARMSGTTVPEPSSYALVILALAGLGATQTRRKSGRV